MDKPDPKAAACDHLQRIWDWEDRAGRKFDRQNRRVLALLLFWFFVVTPAATLLFLKVLR